MIKSLEIKNVLSHKDSLLEFHPGVNMIIGPSGNGKSAILHSFNWVSENRPTGEKHRNWDGGKMLSKIELNEGGHITLSKDKQSQYTVKIPNKKPKIFKAFGANPPEEVPDFLNLHKRINIQTQFESIFLMSESPGEVAKLFSEVAGLEMIKETEAKGKSDLRVTENQHINIKGQIEDKKEELSVYKGIEKLQKKIKKATKIQDTINLNESLIEDLEYTWTDIEEIQNELKRLKKKNKIKGKVTKAFKLMERLRTVKDDISYFESYSKRIKEIQDRSKEIMGKSDILPSVDRALVLCHVIEDRDHEINVLQGNLNDIDSVKQYSKKIKTENKELKKEFNRSMPDECPLCGR